MTKQQTKKIAMICAQYPPASGPGPTRMAAFAEGLAKKGYEPHVFTSEKKPGSVVARWFKLDDLHRPGDEQAGISTGRGKKQPWYEVLVNFFVPMEPTWTLSLLNLISVFKPFAEAEKPSVILTTSNPLASAVGGAMLKRRFKVPLIVEFRDPWTLNPVRNWPTRLHYIVESMLERRVLRTADAIIMNTPTARNNLLKKYDWLDENRLHVISHGYDGEAVSGKNQKTVYNKNSTIRIAYAGGFYLPDSLPVSKTPKGVIRSTIRSARAALTYNIANISESQRTSSPEYIFSAIANHNANIQIYGQEIQMDFIGSVSGQLNSFIKKHHLENIVRILPRVATCQIKEVLSNYDILYLTNPSIPSSPFIGTKTFDYIAVGRPIIAELPESDQSRLITTTKLGWVCPPGDTSSIVKTIEHLLAHNCQILREFTPDTNFIDLFARKHQITDLAAIIEQVAGENKKQCIISTGYLKLDSGKA